MNYGKELIIDLYDCDVETFTREKITSWLKELCNLINMKREDLHFWDYEDCPEEKAKAPDHLVGISAVQFITTSDIVIHTVDRLRECYINIFTCKDFTPKEASDFTAKYFGSKYHECTVIVRGRKSKCQV